MTTDTQNDATPSPFVLSSTVTVNFTNTQLVEIALQTLADRGHDFDESNVKSKFDKNGLTLTVESSEGKPPTKKRTPRKAAAKAPAKPKTEKAEAPKVKEKAEEVTPEVVEAPGNNPFKPATVATSNEEAIAEVKAEAGVAEVTAFSTETVGIEESDTGEAPAAVAFDFNNVGT